MSSRRYIIIGCGVAGISAAGQIYQNDPAAKVAIISDDPHRYYSRPGLAYMLSGEIPEQSLFPTSLSPVLSRVSWINGKVARILKDQHQIQMENNATIAYDRLLIATGAQAMPLKAPGSTLKGLFKLDNLEDARAILAACKSARSAVVVGGGITALELVEALHQRKLKVTYFLRGDRYWSNTLDVEESQQVEQQIKDEGVEIAYQTELAEVIGKNGKVIAVTTKDGRKFACDLLAYAIGVTPRKDLAAQAGLKVDRGVVVSAGLQTSAEDIFAAGDVAQVFDPFTGQTVLNSLWIPARQQGEIAGQNMAGSSAEYRKEVSFNVTRLAGTTTSIIGSLGSGPDANTTGISRGDSETWHLLSDATLTESGSDKNHIRLCVGKEAILGALVMGDQQISHPLYSLIQSRANIYAARETLLQTSRPGDVILNLINDRRIFHAPTQLS